MLVQLREFFQRKIRQEFIDFRIRIYLRVTLTNQMIGRWLTRICNRSFDETKCN